MDQFFDRVAKVPQAQKAALVVMLCAMVVAGWYFMFFQDLQQQKQGLRNEKKRLLKERGEYEQRVQDYLKLRAEIAQLLEEEKELLRVLPNRQEIPTLLESIHAQAELVGLNILTFAPGAESPVEMYFRIPVSMAVQGSYHQLNKFFKNLGELKRIVSVEDLALSGPAPADGLIRLNANFTVTTFRFQDRR